MDCSILNDISRLYPHGIAFLLEPSPYLLVKSPSKRISKPPTCMCLAMNTAAQVNVDTSEVKVTQDVVVGWGGFGKEMKPSKIMNRGGWRT